MVLISITPQPILWSCLKLVNTLKVTSGPWRWTLPCAPSNELTFAWCKQLCQLITWTNLDSSHNAQQVSGRPMANRGLRSFSNWLSPLPRQICVGVENEWYFVCQDSSLLMLNWVEDNLVQWDEFCNESCSWCRINCSAGDPMHYHCVTGTPFREFRIIKGESFGNVACYFLRSRFIQG